MTSFTVEIYKVDRRRKDGKRLIETVEIVCQTREGANLEAKRLTMNDEKLSYELHRTYRKVRNLLSGKMVEEHYKTPYSCSVGSESYFCQ